MARTATVILIGSICLVLAACGDSVHSVQWYQHHKAQRMAEIQHCTALGSDRAAEDQSCRNAANAQAMSGTNTPSSDKGW